MFFNLKNCWFYLLLASSLHACSWFGDPSPSLPPETQNGAETFGCLINGKVFTANEVRKDYDGGIMVGGTNKDNLSVVFSIDNLNKTGTYYYTRNNLGCFTLNGCRYGLQGTPLSGKVEITKFERGEDKANNLRWLIVSGRFEGVITSGSPNCKDTLRITQGRFDVKFN
jgi:hypothetical protein